jgi:hypothetical protein
MLGIFHATFVLSRIVRVFRRLLAAEPSWPELRHHVDALSAKFAKGREVVNTYAKPTEHGRRIIDTLENTAFG